MKPNPVVTELIRKIRRCIKYDGDLVVRYQGCVKEHLNSQLLSVFKGCLDDIERINRLENTAVTPQEFNILGKLTDGTTNLEWVAFHVGQLAGCISKRGDSDQLELPLEEIK